MNNSYYIPSDRRRWPGRAVRLAIAGLMLAGSLPGALAQADLKLRPRLPAPQSEMPGQMHAFLVRNILMAVNQANRTEDYSVLHSKGTPEFRKDNSVEYLAAAFRPYREQNIDLSQVVLVEPVFLEPSGSDGQGRLRLAGYFPTSPLEVQFDLSFSQANGVWLLTAVNVSALPPRSRNLQAAPVSPSAGPSRQLGPARGIPARTTDY